MSENGGDFYTDYVSEDFYDILCPDVRVEFPSQVYCLPLPRKPDIAYCPQLPQGWPYNCDMTRFWMGWQAWLVARGFTLNLRPTDHSTLLGVDWRIPPFAASESGSLPYAYRVRDSEESLRIRDDCPLVSALALRLALLVLNARPVSYCMGTRSLQSTYCI